MARNQLERSRLRQRRELVLERAVRPRIEIEQSVAAPMRIDAFVEIVADDIHHQPLRVIERTGLLGISHILAQRHP